MLIIRPKTSFTLTESRLLKNSQNDEITDFFYDLRILEILSNQHRMYIAYV